MLRTDRGGEYLSKEFVEFCNEQGIQRQLTASYTPQQNGVAERKNQTIINMVRSVLGEKGVPKAFWPEAVMWAVHVLNRSPTLAVKDITPEEAWSGIKPSVSYFRIFGCIGYAYVHNQQRSKLDDKSTKCVLLGVSEESKAYKLYDPVKKKILISRDVKFQEDAAWDWSEAKNSSILDTGELNPLEESSQVAEEKTQDKSNDTAATSSATTTNSSSNVPDYSVPAASESHDQGRTRRPPTWMRDYVTGDALTEEDAMNFAMFAGADPVTYNQASKSQHWRNAMDAEIQAIQRNDTWQLVDPPSNCKVIGVKWIFKTKLKETGEIDKFKARLVAKGYTQEEGIDYGEIFAPVARLETVRTVIAIAATKRWSIYQLDIKSAFLHGEINEDVYLEQPPGYVCQGREHQVYKLKKALYGLKQAPRAWYSKLESHLVTNGFLKCPHEHTLFLKKEGSEILIVCFYVDDLIYTGSDELMFQQFKTIMMNEFAMTDLGKMRYFLGIEVLQSCTGIYIGQKKYIKDMLNRFDMSDCNSVKNPIAPGTRLLKEDKGTEVDSTIYKQLVGSLMYLTATRPDIAHSVSLISRFMEHPKESHFIAAKRILRYLQGTQNLGIFYKAGINEELFAYTDSDYAGDLEDRKSTSGYAFLLAGGVISWVSKKQPVVSLSTTEAEFIAAALCACQCVWLRRILEHLDHYQVGATVMFCDNVSTIKLSKNPVLHGRSKHIDVRFHFLRNLCNDGVIELNFCSTKNQLADIMTKPLKVEDFQRLRSALGMLEDSEINCCKEHAV
uniref:Retrovirus-related Pol polyprotein from transposon TNT 1-94 n=1 Tax=Cajanus cajan TaxID=3821 RepID=A0A151RPW5_CAJCA|nr:Retrovirus-related Pol polyprotein from transposon TNT 1-94 [Cajanus cajan]